MARTWTEEQSAAIAATKQTVLLSAAAGSGKTATLTERLIRMITDEKEPLDVSRMLVVTFTRAAAKELRDRITAALADAIEKDPENRHLLRSSLLLPNAKIRTIDSFCNDLVKGHTETLDISSHYRIPDNAEEALLMHSLMDSVVNDAFAGVFAPEGLDIAFLTECTAEARNEQQLVPLLSHLYEQLSSYPEGVSLLHARTDALQESADKPFFETPFGKEIQKYCIAALTDFKNGLSLASARARAVNDAHYLDCIDSALGAACIHAESLLQACEKGYGAMRALLESDPPPKPSPSSDGKLTDEGLLAKQYLAHYRDEIPALYEQFFRWQEKDLPEAVDQHIRLNRSCALLLEEFARRYTEEKRKRGICTYNDLEHLAYNLLWQKNETGEEIPSPLAEELRGAFDTVCIDEYQDVNYLQHRIFDAISTKTNRFMVGDIKQSIYGFRGAMPEIFASLRASLPRAEENKDSAVLYLTKNFRSYGHLIDFNNRVFDFLFGILREGIGYCEQDRLQTGKPAPEHPLPLPDIHYLYTPSARASLPEGAPAEKKTEGDLIAAHIQSLHKKGTPFHDIAVLVRGRTAINELADSLLRNGIPVCTEDDRNFFLFPEILLAIALLNTVNNPRRDIYLAALLRSPLYRFRMDDLIRIRACADPALPLYDALLRYVEQDPNFGKGVRFLNDLALFRKEAEGMPADKMCRFLFDRTALFAHTDKEGARRLHILYDCARSYEANAFHGLYRFVAYLSELMENGTSLGAARAIGAAGGVTISTIHQSKGLEYPVCILANAAPHKRPVTDPFFFHPRLGLGFFARDDAGYAKIENPLRHAVKCAVAADYLQEEARVLYVALTRASEQLTITAHGTAKPEKHEQRASLLRAFPSLSLLGASSFLDWILAAANDPTLCRVRTGTYNELFDADADGMAPTASESEKENAPHASEEGEDWEAVYRKRFSFVYPHADESLLPGKISVSKLYPHYLDDKAQGEEDAAEAFRAVAIPPAEADNVDTKASPILTETAEADFSKKQEKKGEAPLTVPFFLSHEESDRSAKAGIATHLFLQFCRFDKLLQTNGLQNEAKSRVQEELAYLVEKGFLHPTDAERVRIDELTAFAASPLMERILAAKKIHREFRFNVMLPAHLFSADKARFEDLSVFTQGVIDLLIEEEDGSLVLVDYKTDRLNRAMLKDRDKARDFLLDRHKTQLTYYAHAVEKIFGKQPKEAAIYSLHAASLFSFAFN